MTVTRDPRLGNPDWVDNWTVGPGLRFEFIDGDGRVWLCQEPLTKERVRSLQLPDGATPALLGEAIADVAYFGRSPDASVDGPLDTVEVDGLRFSFVARPGKQRRVHQDGVDQHGAEGATVLSVNKHHTMLYAAGRTVEVLDFGDGTFAPPAWAGPDRPPSDTGSAGWVRRSVHLATDLIAAIPAPSEVVIFDDGFGFHGPLPITTLESAQR